MYVLNWVQIKKKEKTSAKHNWTLLRLLLTFSRKNFVKTTRLYQITLLIDFTIEKSAIYR